ncbi:hypothetical protein Pmani_021909 [Petrolisthes manimaculis]|uniref:Uncharacterized protein n=1 Tax=Petrolisthes manimaculis TaxID=1843537 RepID=A0AAE1U167_9EUCA|nr:hypothetical protein Pmani_021909 [Petrolisthes manimaculis]
MEVAGEGLGQKRQGRESEDEVGSALEGPIRWRVCSWRVAHLPHQGHAPPSTTHLSPMQPPTVSPLLRPPAAPHSQPLAPSPCRPTQPAPFTPCYLVPFPHYCLRPHPEYIPISLLPPTPCFGNTCSPRLPTATPP